MAKSSLIEKLMILTAPVVALSTDEQGIIRLVNPAVFKVFGYYEGEVMGHNLLMLLPELERIEYESFIEVMDRGELEFFGDDEEELDEILLPENYNFLERFINGEVAKGKKKGEIQTKDKNGQIKWVDIAINKMNIDEEIMYSVVVNDITDIKKSEGALLRVNEHLEEMVAERTAEVNRKSQDIQTMLQNLPQGILTFNQDLLVHDEYSVYLETILETTEVAESNIMDLLFSNSNLGADTLSQMFTAMQSILDEEAFLFDCNSHLLVTTFEKTFVGGKVKSLDLSWSAIINDQDIVEKLLVSMRDVTEIMALQEAASHQKKELEIIGQILSISSNKFMDFILGTKEFIQENRALIAANAQNISGTLDTLFRNMHTIKGNARTYGFDHLTDFIHQVEQEYSELRENPNKIWDQQYLLAQLDETEHLVGEYTKVNEEKLGRKIGGVLGAKAEYLMINKEQLTSLTNQIDDLENADSQILLSTLRDIKNIVELSETEPFEQIISGILQAIPKLANELEKPEPKIVIDDGDIVFKKQVFQLFKNTFMHLFRNSLDHGLETSKERIIKGKHVEGTIKITIRKVANNLEIRYADDGKGLDLVKIRRKAIAAHYITETEALNAESVSKLIFKPGLSTSDKVTDVSGRGVGMDAVKNFFEQQKGSIELSLPHQFTEEDRSVPVELVMTLPSDVSLEKLE
ncbi:MAG: two-component system chemotaxis sensor kinase CheA [Pseudohongiellaceae bacterium]|jgi:two-component system chemotaxis sensor kinase CheA